MTQLPKALLMQSPPSQPATIALSEGSDPRIVAGALAAQSAGLAKIILVGTLADIQGELTTQTGTAEPPQGITIHDPETSDLIDAFAQAYFEKRQHKGIDLQGARAAVQTPVGYAAMLVQHGQADGTVGGAVYTTGEIVRNAIQIIGLAENTKLVSSFFLMYPPEDAPEGARAMVYSDCGLVIDPSVEELVEIAKASAQSCTDLLLEKPRIAMLSFSTQGSAEHPKVDKVIAAAEALQADAPDLRIEGELQFDAAFTASVGARKAPDSRVAGRANVMIFPNLDAGNIGYKITQRLGGYSAIGPVLQGLAKPANDLSRGCSAEDVTEMIAVTALQAGNRT